MTHLKRLRAPLTWKTERKTKKWAVAPSPGPHPAERSIPLAIVIRDYLKLAGTAREAKKIISSRDVLVDGKARIDHKFPCGLMDIVSFPKIEEHYRVLIDSRGILRLVKITEEEAKWKLSRIENKTVIKKGKMQLNMHDGRNIIVEEDDYKTGDVLKISIPEQEIIEKIPMKKGYVALIIGGTHAGEISEIEEIMITMSPSPNIVKLKEFSTIKQYVFSVGKDKPMIELPKVDVYG